jgi:hypothetical protein
VDEFLKITDNIKPDIYIAIDSAYKNLFLKNSAKLVPIIETIMFCGRREVAGDNDGGPIFICSADNNDGNFRSLDLS